MPKAELGSTYWNNRYISGKTGWDLGEASPAIVAYFASQRNKDVKILIPGCGNAHEAEALIQLGFTNITLIDISEELVSTLQSRFAKNDSIHVELGDFFEFSGTFDVVIEQTFFCAIDPALRSKYVHKMHQLLNKGGKIVGLMFNREFPDGPPFGGTQKEYKTLFSGKFNTKMDECKRSISARLGSELWVQFDKI